MTTLKRLTRLWITGCAALICFAAQADTSLELTIRPLDSAQVPTDYFGSYVPLSDGGVIDFSSWMAQKYGLAGWLSDAALLDQATGRTALTVYGLDRVTPDAFDEDAYSFAPQLPGCGLLTKLLWGQTKCQPDWQENARQLVGNAVATPQMIGFLDFNQFNALTQADLEFGRVRLGAPAATLSLVP